MEESTVTKVLVSGRQVFDRISLMEYFRNKFVVVGMIFAVSFFVGAQYPQNSISRHAWGFPLVYRWVIKEEFRIPEQAYSHFSIFLFAFNVLILFLSVLCTWYFLSWLVYRIRLIVYKLRA
ncbi:MAG: hypothetical protein UT84_C0010G0009 [Candidatus Curtissbacteria bacterium GW2011_GWA1_40_16]|uniref:Uncharacterized protein n=1 Tax=Candidatus Curtissbacteria bacterium GW2011_GWA1_40_16 TaxID=1618405 RepID=A0A0G0RL46_9BACT|nr:MAG: hypothetical protein UT84_C0010G0009 [Candidatus Curtissbacteria bacterium GW2011_GWA1_40_16]